MSNIDSAVRAILTSLSEIIPVLNAYPMGGILFIALIAVLTRSRHHPPKKQP